MSLMECRVPCRARFLVSFSPPVSHANRILSSARLPRAHLTHRVQIRHYASNRPSKTATPAIAIGKKAAEPPGLAKLPSLKPTLQKLHALISHSAAPNDEAVVEQLRKCKDIATELRNVPATLAEDSQVRGPSSARKLLVLDDGQRSAGSAKEKAIDELSESLFEFVAQPKVFLSPQVLDLYVQIQSTLRRPETIAEIFQLYANKPVPLRDTSPVRYKKVHPSRLASAIPPETASKALDAAIESRILPLCLDVIDSSVCTPAYRRRKIIQKMWLPAAVLTLTPPAAWLLAVSFDQWQITLTSRYARTLAFTGFASYVGFTAILGYVALTTANDQMERVTWRDGLPLTTRWLREDERAMLDRVAMAWGFKDRHRRGEEDGPEWEALKELVSMRDMILDRVELMDGME